MKMEDQGTHDGPLSVTEQMYFGTLWEDKLHNMSP